MPTGTKTGSLQTLANCGGIAPNQSLAFSGSPNPQYGITAPAALQGTISGGVVTLGSQATFAGTEKVAVFWTVGNTSYYRYDCTISAGTNQTTFTVSAGSGTSLPTGGQAVLLATNVDLTQAAEGVSIVGEQVQQLIATSTQIGLVEWLSSAPAQQRLSYINAAGGFDTWPSTSGQPAPPSGGAGSNWSAATTVVTLRFWNFSTSTAQMQVGAILT
jgi:hypothetical protein